MNAPTIGRIVLYTLSLSDVRNIESYRKNYPPGTPYNLVAEGMIFPAIVVAIPQGITGSVSLQVFLDGFDTHWAPSRYEDDVNGDVGQEGRWHWPVRERVNEIKQSDPAVFIDMPPAPSAEEKRRQQEQYLRMDCLRIATDFLKERAGGTPAEFLAFADDIFAFAQRETPGIPAPTATTENTVPGAMKVVTEAVLNDKAYAHSWHCNVACSIMDEGVDPVVSNRAASRFMKLLFNAETSGDMMMETKADPIQKPERPLPPMPPHLGDLDYRLMRAVQHNEDYAQRWTRALENALTDMGIEDGPAHKARRMMRILFGVDA